MKRVCFCIISSFMTILCFASQGALPGVFSVSATLKVYFSQGNLQYNAKCDSHQCADGSTQPGTWRFAEHQWDTIGINNKYISSSYNGWIDLFGWGTSGWNSGATAYQPWSASTTNTDYLNQDLFGDYANADWGVYNAIINGGNTAGVWRTLTSGEWYYMLAERPNADDKKAVATVNGIEGIVLLPDDWTLPSGLTFTSGMGGDISLESYRGKNDYTLAQWQTMENAGAIFLPNAGARNGNTTYTRGAYELYQTSTNGSSENNYMFSCSGNGISINSNPKVKRQGVSVRLVCELPSFAVIVNSLDAAGGAVNGSGIYNYGTNLQITATPNECYLFTKWSDGNTDNPRTITVTGDATYTAEFTKLNYTIRGQNTSTTGGSVQIVNP